MQFSISTFGIVLALSYLLGVFLFWRWGRREGFSSDDLFDLVLVSSLGALAGGKLPPFFVEIPSDFFSDWVFFEPSPSSLRSGPPAGPSCFIFFIKEPRPESPFSLI